MSQEREIAILGGGCFWCTEAIFKSLKGVISVNPGYSGGAKPNPTYEEVCSGRSNYVEVVKIEFDKKIISYAELLKVFFDTHDPTSIDKQGNDTGSQYRSIIFYFNEEQNEIAQNIIKKINEGGEQKIVTQLKPFENFYAAEEYHKDYYLNNQNAPYCQLVISPKIKKLESNYSNLIKNDK